MNRPDAAAILRKIAASYRPTWEAIDRQMLLDALDLPEERRLRWSAPPG